MAADSSQEVTTARLEAFSDGVFAIAATLLILEIKSPDQTALQHQSLFQYLWHLWPKYFAYALSFFTIGIYWSNHHYIFKLYKRTDHIFNMINVMFLMVISFFPFPAAIFGEYVNDPVHRQHAVSFFAIAIYLPAFVWFMMWLYAKHKKRLIDPHLSDKFVRYLTRLFLISNIIYFVSFLISLFSPITSIVLNILLTLLYLLPRKKPEYS